MDDFEKSSDQRFNKPKLHKNRKPSKTHRAAGSRPTSSRSSRPLSAPGTRPGSSGHQAWLDSLKFDNRAGYNSSYAHTLKHKTPTEFFVDTLRKTGKGLGKEPNRAASTFSGLSRNFEQAFPYRSTSHYLRQRAGVEPVGRRPRSASASGRPASGTPNYKDPEEYYEEVLSLKKEMRILIDQNTSIQSKLCRVEKDNLKKEREIEQLLSPAQSDEMRRTLADRKPDTGATLHSLKKKILSLEQRLRDKETQCMKIQNDVKYTRTEELKVQKETLYREVVRLQHLLQNNEPHRRRGAAEAMPEGLSDKKMKALNDVILRLSEEKKRLQEQNQKLLQDLDLQLDSSGKHEELRASYKRMGKTQLLEVITRLERRIAQHRDDNEASGKNRIAKGKLVLSGSDSDRLNALDQRETELLAEVQKQSRMTRDLRQDNERLRRELADKDNEVLNLKQDVEDALAGRPLTPHRSRKSSLSSSRKEKKSRHEEWDSSSFRERRRNADKLREVIAARRIQRYWKEYTFDKATSSIQGALRSHIGRKQRIRQLQRRKSSSYGSEGSDDGVLQIQSAFRGHMARKEQLRKQDRSYPIELESDADSYKESHNRRSRDGISSRAFSDSRRSLSRERGGSREQRSGLKRRPLDDDDSEQDDYYSPRDRPHSRLSRDRDDAYYSNNRDDFGSSQDRFDSRRPRSRERDSLSRKSREIRSSGSRGEDRF